MTANPLTLHGGTPVRTEPFSPWPYFPQDEIAAATACLTSGRVNYWTGSEGREFEREFDARQRHAAILKECFSRIPALRVTAARGLGETSLMFLVHPTLTDADMADTCRGVEKVMALAAR